METKIELMALPGLRSAKRNPKTHAEAEIQGSISRFGFVEPLVLDERTHLLVAGHGRRDALLALWRANGPAPKGVHVQDGQWYVPVLRGWESVNDQEAEAYLLTANKLVEAGGWNDAELAAMVADLEKFAEGTGSGLGWSDKEIRALLQDAANGLGGVGSGDTNQQPEHRLGPKRPLFVREGDMWELGEIVPHRILCGDSHVPANIERLLAGDKAPPRLMVTDPPYAIYGSSTGIGADIADDKMVRPFFESIFRLAHRLLPAFAHAYLFTDWRSWSAMWEAAKRAEMTAKNMIVWDKGGGGLGSNYANAHELVFFCAKLPPPTAMKSTTQSGQRSVNKPNIMRYSRVTGDERRHNAAKPPELVAELVEASSDPGDIVLEPFSGSGTTLIVCERMGRGCRALDLEPKWVQTAIEWWEEETGQKARLLHREPEPETMRAAATPQPEADGAAVDAPKGA